MAIAVGNPAKINGKLSVKKSTSKPSADEPADTLQAKPSTGAKPLSKSIQGGKFNPGASPGQSSNTPSPQDASDAVGAKGGLKGAIKAKMYGKLKVAR